MTNQESAKIKSKISKLLALGTSANPNEAKTAMRQAMTLMAKHSICETELSVDKTVTTEYISGFTKLPPWCRTLANMVSLALGVYCVYRQGQGSHKAQLWFTGEKGAAERVEYIYVTAYRKIEAMSQEFRMAHVGITASDTNDYKRGVAISYAARVKEVYGDMEQELADAIGTGLIKIDDRVSKGKDFYAANNGDVVSSKPNHRNSNALHKGISDGKNAQISEGVRGNTDKVKMLG
jgi:hypothetical protein